MAAGKVCLSRRVDLSHVSKRVSNRCVVPYVDYDVKDCGVRDDEFMDVEKAIAPPPKRRKFSPVVWDKEGSIKRRTIGIDDDYEPGEIEEEDYGRALNITTSRWAVDDDVVESDEKMGGASKRVEEIRRKSSSPESGITQKDGSDCPGFRSSGSDEGHLRRYYGGDQCSESDSDDDDCMDVDMGDDEGLLASESDSDSDDCSLPLAREPVRRNMLQGCRSVYEFERLGKISEGSYGIVHKARDKSSGELVALKKMKMMDKNEGFSVCYLREINTLLALNHPSIVNVREVAVDKSADDAFNNVFMVMDYVEHDLKALMQLRKQAFSQSEVKCLMLQLLEGVKYLHDNWVLHRDLKTSNLLVNNKGKLKICDFGMARQYGSPLKPYTSLVITLWYRAPELLLGAKEYSTAVDMWSVGCIMAELLKNQPLFDGKTEPEQINKIFKLLGTPNKKIWPGFFQLPGAKAKFADHPYNRLHTLFPRAVFTGCPILSDSGLDLLSRLLTYDPEKRITAEEALSHRWFQEVPLPKSKEFMPTFPAEKIFDELQVQGHGTSGRVWKPELLSRYDHKWAYALLLLRVPPLHVSRHVCQGVEKLVLVSAK